MSTITHNVELSLAQTISNVEAISPGATDRILAMVKGYQYGQPMYGQQNHNYGQLHQRQCDNRRSHFDTNPSDHNQYFLAIVDSLNGLIFNQRYAVDELGKILLLCPDSPQAVMYVLSEGDDASYPGKKRLLLTYMTYMYAGSDFKRPDTRVISRIEELPTEMLKVVLNVFTGPTHVNVRAAAKDCWLSVALSRFYSPRSINGGYIHYDIYNESRGSTINWGGVSVTKNVLDWFIPNRDTLASINCLIDLSGYDQAFAGRSSGSMDLHVVINRFKQMLDVTFEAMGVNLPSDTVLVCSVIDTTIGVCDQLHFRATTADGGEVYFSNGAVTKYSEYVDELLDFFDVGSDGNTVKWATETATEYQTETCAVFKEVVDSGVYITQLITALKHTPYRGTGRSMFDWLFGSDENRELLKQQRLMRSMNKG